MDISTLLAVLSIPVIVVVAHHVINAMFWCFCWLFCKVDDRVQNWDYRNVTVKDIEALAREFDQAA